MSWFKHACGWLLRQREVGLAVLIMFTPTLGGSRRTNRDQAISVSMINATGGRQSMAMPA